jgi:hypothetical protein
MRISLVESSVPKKSTSLTRLNAIDASDNETDGEIFINNRQIAQKKSKSPFRKYERCIREANQQQKSLSNTLIRPRNSSTMTTTSVTLHQPSSKTVLVTRSSPIQQEKKSGSNNSNNDSKIKGSGFDDLVITCVESGPIVKDNNVVCYKKRYLVNMGGSNWNLYNNQNSASTSSTTTEKSIKFETKIGQSSSTSNRSRNRFNDRVEINLREKQPLRKRSQSPINGDDSNFTPASSRTTSFCNRCRSVVSRRNEEEHETFVPIKMEIKTAQPPLGAPDNRLFTAEKKVRFDFDDSLSDIDLNPETAEQFIDLLIAEDSLLRNKIRSGDVDPQTLRKLERLTELRLKYIKYKQQLNEERARSLGVLIPSRDQVEQKSFTNFNSATTASSTNTNDNNSYKSLTVTHNKKDRMPTPPPPPSSTTQNFEEEESIKQQKQQQSSASSISSSVFGQSPKLEILNLTSPTIKPITVFHDSEIHASNSNFNSSGVSSSCNYSSSKRSAKIFKANSKKAAIKSLKDSAFSSELRLHPLIRENSYLMSKFD